MYNTTSPQWPRGTAAAASRVPSGEGREGPLSSAVPHGGHLVLDKESEDAPAWQGRERLPPAVSCTAARQVHVREAFLPTPTALQSLLVPVRGLRFALWVGRSQGSLVSLGVSLAKALVLLMELSVCLLPGCPLVGLLPSRRPSLWFQPSLTLPLSILPLSAPIPCLADLKLGDSGLRSWLTTPSPCGLLGMALREEWYLFSVLLRACMWGI